MKSLKSDVIVLGLSLAGIGAAQSLRDKGYTVILCELQNDIALRAMSALIDPFNDASVTGAAFDAIVRERLNATGVILLENEVEIIDWHEWSDSVRLILRTAGSEPQIVTAKAAIIAPNGGMPKGDYPKAWERLIGYGVSESVWSDGPFVVGKPACVQGCGWWAIDQALMLKQWAPDVTVLCERESMCADTPFPDVTCYLNCRIISLNDHRGKLDSISVNQHGASKIIPCSGLFLCPEPVMEWEVLGRFFTGRALIESDKVALAGVAAGVPFGSQSSLYRNGVKAGANLAGALKRK